MAKEQKTKEELERLLNEAIQRYRLGSNPDEDKFKNGISYFKDLRTLFIISPYIHFAYSAFSIQTKCIDCS